MSALTLAATGVPTAQDLERVTPPAERRAKGPVVVVECFQRIPCDPCHYACKFGAIKEFADLNDTPTVDWDKCTGCGLCVAACPGLAVFVIDETASESDCLIAMPFEFTPLPAKGASLLLLDRAGVEVGRGCAERVIPGRKPEGTPVVWVRAPKRLSLVVRNFRVEEGD
jgi:Fe-S-cluster-containing hydrogenase component 2